MHLSFPVLTFVLGCVITLAFSTAGIRYLAPLGWMDLPGPRKEHGKPTPRTGGIALWASVALGSAFGWLQLPIGGAEWGCLHGLALLGLVDDRFSLGARTKSMVGLALAFAMAIPLCQAYALDRPEIVLLGLHLPTRPMVFTLPLAALWFWALPQSFNLIDGLDGLVCGLSIIILLAFQMGLRTGHGTYLLGAVVATFLLNWPRARHFLGDTGAYFLGGLLAILAFKTKAWVYPSHALWIFAYPILDTTLVVLIRLLLRKPLGHGDRNHYHHHLSRLLGRRSRWAVPILWAMGAALAARPLYLAWSGPLAWSALWVMIGAGAWFCWRARFHTTERV